MRLAEGRPGAAWRPGLLQWGWPAEPARRGLGTIQWIVMGARIPPWVLGSWLHADVVVALGRAEIAWFDTAQIDDEFLQNHGRIDHPELQRVIAGFGHGQGGLGFADGIADGGLPVAETVLRESVDDLGRLAVERNGIPQ